MAGTRRRQTQRPRRPSVVGVVACSASKFDPADFGKNTLPARQLYSKSDLFTKAAAFAEANTDDWVILSAKYGVVHPDDELPAYEKRLPRGGDRAWAKGVRESLDSMFDPAFTHYVVLAGADYRKHVFEPGGYYFEAPLAGLGIGQQKAWLKSQLEDF